MFNGSVRNNNPRVFRITATRLGNIAFSQLYFALGIGGTELSFNFHNSHSHLESTRLTSSEHSLIAVSASVPRPLCYSLPLMISRIVCHAMVTPGVLLLTT